MTTPSKCARDVFEACFNTGEPVLVTCSTAGCLLPNHLYEGDEVISLVYGRYLATPIPDLFVGKRALQATLLFKGVPHYCSVPWSAITAISDPRGVWFDATSPAPSSGADWRPRPQ